jgi:hypothetical protein
MEPGEVRKMVDVKMTPEVEEVVGKRGLKKADIESVINSGEKNKKGKIEMKATGRSISKGKVGDVTIYADYDLEKKLLGSHAALKTAYSHRMALGDIVNSAENTEWTCANCGNLTKVGTTEMQYMGVKRNGPTIVCTTCKDSWVEEYLATKTLAAAEGLFEKKKA